MEGISEARPERKDGKRGYVLLLACFVGARVARPGINIYLF